MKTFCKLAIVGMAVAGLSSASSVLCNTLNTLQDYINAGACQVDNIVFSNFSYSGSMAGDPADTIGPPLNPAEGINGGYITASQVAVLTDQGGMMGALQFRGVWDIMGPDTDPNGGPPPGPVDGSTGPAYETLNLTFDVTPIAGHQVTNLFSQNQTSTGGDGTLTQNVGCSAPCATTPLNFADSLVTLPTPVTDTFEVQNGFQFVSNDETSDSHLSVINVAVSENSMALDPTPEPGTILGGLSGLVALAAFRKLRNV